MQVTVERRLARSLMYGMAWTWSKALDLEDSDQNTVNPFINPRIRNYGKGGFDVTHNVVINYDYKLPGLKNNRILNAVVGIGRPQEFSPPKRNTVGNQFGNRECCRTSRLAAVQESTTGLILSETRIFQRANALTLTPSTQQRS